MWTALDAWILIIGCLAGVACGLLGCFLVLRRMSMMGDAISHAILPGLAGAFLVTVAFQRGIDASGVELPAWLDSIVMVNARSSPVMFIGAAIVGVLTALFTQLLHRLGRVEQSAAMGVVFTTLFALGLVLIVRAADEVDLDPGCVLYGAIELAPLDTVDVAGLAVPRVALTLGIVTVIVIGLIALFYKELKITSFDPTLATTLGIRANVMHYLLMIAVAITAVAAFEAVGSILVVAFLIVPGATAHLLTDRLSSMLVTAVLVAIVGAALGALVVVPGSFFAVDTSAAGTMTVMLGLVFLLAFLFSPRHGVISRIVHRAQLTLRIVREDLLGLLYRMEEHGVREPAARVRARFREAVPTPAWMTRLAVVSLRRDGLLRAEAAGCVLTDEGRRRARGLVRAHRLWETYLHKHLVLPADHVHDTAMKLEHFTGTAMEAKLEENVEHAERDPHGAVIPREE
jgi:manganese/zinc/iron transport system permease protein